MKRKLFTAVMIIFTILLAIILFVYPDLRGAGGQE